MRPPANLSREPHPDTEVLRWTRTIPKAVEQLTRNMVSLESAKSRYLQMWMNTYDTNEQQEIVARMTEVVDLIKNFLHDPVGFMNPESKFHSVCDTSMAKGVVKLPKIQDIVDGRLQFDEIPYSTPQPRVEINAIQTMTRDPHKPQTSVVVRVVDIPDQLIHPILERRYGVVELRRRTKRLPETVNHHSKQTVIGSCNRKLKLLSQIWTSKIVFDVQSLYFDPRAENKAAIDSKKLGKVIARNLFSISIQHMLDAKGLNDRIVLKLQNNLYPHKKHSAYYIDLSQLLDEMSQNDGKVYAADELSALETLFTEAFNAIAINSSNRPTKRKDRKPITYRVMTDEEEREIVQNSEATSDGQELEN